MTFQIFISISSATRNFEQRISLSALNIDNCKKALRWLIILWKVENEDIIDIVLCCNSLGTKDNVTETEHALSHRTTDLQEPQTNNPIIGSFIWDKYNGLDCQRKNEEWRPMREAGMHRTQYTYSS